jgi:hypothetical protein
METMAMMSAMRNGEDAPTAQEIEDKQEKEKETWSEPRRRLDKAFTGTNFDMGLGLVIVGNIACIVMETNRNAMCAALPNNDPCASDTLFKMNLVFQAIYTIEASMRIYTYRCPRLCGDMPFMFDFLIVSLGYLDLFLAVAASDHDIPGFAVLRIFRVARLARAIRVLRGIPELYSMVRSFFAAMSAMFWGFMIILMMLMMWEILAVEMIHPVNMELMPEDEWCKQAFSKVEWCMLIFFQTLVAGDSWGACAVDIVQEESLTFFIFAGALVSVKLGFTNLILAVICEKATSTRGEDQMEAIAEVEQHRRDAATDVFEMCKAIDRNGSGDETITLRELQKAYSEMPEMRKCFELMVLDEPDIVDLFQILDKGSGSVRCEEFAKCLTKISNTDVRTQISLLTMEVDDIRKRKMSRRSEIRDTLRGAVQEAIQEFAGSEAGLRQRNLSGPKPAEPVPSPSGAPSEEGVQREPKANAVSTGELLATEFLHLRQRIEQDINV